MTPAGEALRAELRAAIVRAGWSETARRSGLGRPLLHRNFRAAAVHSPSLNTVGRIADALGFELHLVPRGALPVAGPSNPTGAG